jgi:hypothetical protein
MRTGRFSFGYGAELIPSLSALVELYLNRRHTLQYARSIGVRDEGGHSDNRYTADGIGSKGTNFTQQLEAVHSRHLNVGHHQIRVAIFCCLKSFNPIPRQHDVGTQAIQEQNHLSARIVMWPRAYRSQVARFRIASQALQRFKARPVTSVPAELTLWNRGRPL